VSRTHVRRDAATITFDLIKYVLLTLGAVICVLPFWLIVAGSLSNNAIVAREGFSLWPQGFTWDAYAMIFKGAQDLIQAYKMNFYYTFVGTGVGLMMTALAGYVISRKEFKYRNTVSFLIYFTSIFGGGLIAWYVMYAVVLGLNGNPVAIWFPALMTPFQVILMRTFIAETIPDAVIESAKLDGAGHVTIFSRIVLPMIKPGLATVGLFLALGYWNDWYRASVFSVNKSTWSLQYYLYNLLNANEAMKQMSHNIGTTQQNLPTETMRLAMAVVSTGPVLLFYPFVQRYFISGIAVGAVKG